MFDLASIIGALWVFLLTPSWLKFHIGLWYVTMHCGLSLKPMSDSLCLHVN